VLLGPAAALSARAAVIAAGHPGFRTLNGVALGDPRAGLGAAMGRSGVDVTGACRVSGGGPPRTRKFLQPSRHRLGCVWRDRGSTTRKRWRRGWRAAASTITQQVAKEKPVSCGRAASLVRQGAGVSARAVDRPGAAEAADPWKIYLKYRRTRAVRAVRRARQAPPTLSAARPSSLTPPRGRALLAAILPNPVVRARGPAIPAPGRGRRSWPRSIWCGSRAGGLGVAAGRKIAVFEPIFRPQFGT